MTLIKRIIDFFIGGRSLGQFVRYLVVGFSSFFLEFTIFYGLLSWVGLGEIAANSIAITIVFWFNFLLNRFWSFKSNGAILRQVIQYGFLFAFNIMFSNGFIYVVSIVLGLSPLIAKVLSMGFIVMWNFVIYKKIIYRESGAVILEAASDAHTDCCPK